MEDEDLLYEVFINAIENSYNENRDKEIIENINKLYNKLAKVVQTYFWDEWDEKYLIDDFDIKDLKSTIVNK